MSWLIFHQDEINKYWRCFCSDDTIFRRLVLCRLDFCICIHVECHSRLSYL